MIEYSAARIDAEGRVHRTSAFTTFTELKKAAGYVEWLNTEHYENLRMLAANEDLMESNHWHQAFDLIESTKCVLVQREVTAWVPVQELSHAG